MTKVTYDNRIKYLLTIKWNKQTQHKMYRSKKKKETINLITNNLSKYSIFEQQISYARRILSYFLPSTIV